MRREELKSRLYAQTKGVHVSPGLARRAALAAQAEGTKAVHMKKGSMAVVFALVAVLLCGAALAAASRWGMLDFIGRYQNSYVPADAADYVKSEAITMKNELATATLRELYYDGKTSRMVVDVAAKQENTLLLGEDAMMEDPFGNLTGEYGEDMRSVYDVFTREGYRHALWADVWMEDAAEGPSGGTMTYRLNEDGTMTFYVQSSYETDLQSREVTFGMIVQPGDEPVTRERYANYDKHIRTEKTITLTAQAQQEIYVSTGPVEYPTVGVRVDEVRIEVKPQELYATVDFTVIDPAAYAGTDGGLWFEFIDPASTETEPYRQRLAEGLTAYGEVRPMNGDPQTATAFRQTMTLGKNELHDSYNLRAYDAWEKGRYEAHEIAMRPAAADEMK